MGKKVLKISIGVLILFALINVVVYFSMWNSDAFTVAKNHIQSDKSVIGKLGNAFEMSLQPYGYGISSDGNIGDAHLVVSAVADDNEATVFVELVQKNGDWSVISSKVH